ncbi:MAG: DAK2 domain-containing protein [Lachnospiraceae bacterium]|nr:DAK2 domain-containing protein [Lachnospiraceae bacterium]
MGSASKLKGAFLAGASLLYQNRDYVNELNVFPVPDGDTGTNMSMTLKSACEAVNATSDDNIEEVCKAIASGSLRGARGNSGVIMSQILRGFTNNMKDAKVIDTKLLLESVQKARDTAYKAVVKPKEGTILTVINALAEKASEMTRSSISDIEKLEQVVAYGDEVLSKTPEMLPILKEAGVVDSGGQGLMYFAHGVLSYIKGEKVDISFDEKTMSKSSNINLKVVEDQDIKFGYCTECIINTAEKFKDNATEEIINYLEGIGDSLVVVGDEQYIKIHVHTNHPGRVFEKGLEYGFLTNLKVDNLKLEHQEKVIKDAEKKAKEFAKEHGEEKKAQVKLKEVGFIAVSNGEGITTFLNELGCDKVITGGQTMNPSTEDFLNAISEVHAKKVFIFPNNSNIIMAAKQAKDIVKDKEVYVIETKNVLQGINCMIYFTEKEKVEDMIEQFKTSIKNVKTIQTTYSIRNTIIDGIDIKENDYISLGDKGLLYTNSDIVKSIFGAYEKIKEDKDTVVSIYFGDSVTEKDANKIKDEFSKKYQNLEVNVYEGDQPVYYYYISIE